MTTYRDWSITASANTGNAADGFFKENMKYQDVNDAARAMQAILARDRLDKSGTIRTTGTSASYELSVNANLPSLADGDMFVFDAHVKNAGAAELQIKADGTATFSSMAIVNTDLSALTDGQLQAGGVYAAVFRSASASSRQFQLLNPSYQPQTLRQAAGIVVQSTGQDPAVTLRDTDGNDIARVITSSDDVYLEPLQNDSNAYIRVNDGGSLETAIGCVQSGAVTLYFDNSAKLSTTTSGIDVTGTLLDVDNSGNDTDAALGTRNTNGGFFVRTQNGDGAVEIVQTDSSWAEEDIWVRMVRNDAVNLYFNGSAKLATTNTGIDVTGNVAPTGFFKYGPGTELTISSGAVTATGSYHSVDTESDAASDDLDTINGQAPGRILILQAANTARTVVLKDGTGNLRLGGDRSLTNTNDLIVLFGAADSTNWLELSFSDNDT